MPTQMAFGAKAVATTDPGATALAAHMRSAQFRAGEDCGHWQVMLLCWPLLVVAVRASDGHVVGLRLDLLGYPAIAPTGTPWDLDTDAPLSPHFWPTGPRTSMVFNPGWNPSALYMPYDRVAQRGHESWRDQFPQHVWTSANTVVDYLSLVSDVLCDAIVPGRTNV